MKERGFTLTELMVTLAIGAILVTVAVPNFQYLININALTTDTNRFVLLVTLARSEAIKRGTVVSLCGGDATNGCNGNWINGQILFMDGNANCTLDKGEEIIRFGEGFKGDNQIKAVNCISYNALGVKSQGASNGNPDFTICNPNLTSENVREIVISPTGYESVNKKTQVGCS
jgi:type IV fimbrial biogenesis protein FimT